MTGIVVLIVLGVIGVAVVWARMTTARAERRSVVEHEHRLDVLGHVAKRSDAAAGVRAPAPNELGRPHVLPSDPTSSFRRTRSDERQVIAPRVRLNPPVPPGVTAARMPVFGDDLDAVSTRSVATPKISAVDGGRGGHDRMHLRGRFGFRSHARHANVFDPRSNDDVLNDVVEDELSESIALNMPPEPAVELDEVTEPTPVKSTRPSTVMVYPRVTCSHVNRRTLTGAAAAVALGAMAIAGWQLAVAQSSRNQHVANGQTDHSHGSKSHGSSSFSGDGSVIEPVSSSNGVVTYPAPSGTYTVSFSANGPCWLGVEQTPSASGPWLAMQTLVTNGTWTRQAIGSIAVRIGAPKTLTITVDGEALMLPASTNPYDIVFSSTNATSA